MSAFKNDPQLVAAENAVPTHMRSLASAARRIVGEEFLNARKAVPWLTRAPGDGPTVRLRPGRHDPTHVKKRIPNRSQLPINDGGELRAIVAEHDVGQMIVAMQQARREARWRIADQPICYSRNAWDRSRTGPVLIVMVAVEERAPSWNLPLQKAIDLAEILQTGCLVVDAPERQSAVDQRKSHAPSDCGVSSMERRQRNRGIEPVHRLHQIKGRADHIGRLAGSDQAGMWNVGTGEGAKDPRLTVVGGIAVAARTARRPPQDVAATTAFEPQQNILRAARQGGGILNRAPSKATIIHPGAQLAEIDEILPGVLAHASLRISRHHDARLGPYSSTARSRACCVW